MVSAILLSWCSIDEWDFCTICPFLTHHVMQKWTQESTPSSDSWGWTGLWGVDFFPSLFIKYAYLKVDVVWWGGNRNGHPFETRCKFSMYAFVQRFFVCYFPPRRSNQHGFLLWTSHVRRVHFKIDRVLHFTVIELREIRKKGVTFSWTYVVKTTIFSNFGNENVKLWWNWQDILLICC